MPSPLYFATAQSGALNLESKHLHLKQNSNWLLLPLWPQQSPPSQPHPQLLLSNNSNNSRINFSARWIVKYILDVRSINTHRRRRIYRPCVLSNRTCLGTAPLSYGVFCPYIRTPYSIGTDHCDRYYSSRRHRSYIQAHCSLKVARSDSWNFVREANVSILHSIFHTHHHRRNRPSCARQDTWNPYGWGLCISSRDSILFPRVCHLWHSSHRLHTTRKCMHINAMQEVFNDQLSWLKAWWRTIPVAWWHVVGVIAILVTLQKELRKSNQSPSIFEEYDWACRKHLVTR